MKPADYQLITAGEIIFFNGVGLVILNAVWMIVASKLGLDEGSVYASVLLWGMLALLLLIAGMCMWGSGAAH